MKFLKWELDKWDSLDGNFYRYDKVEHFFYAFLGVLFFFYGMPIFFPSNPPAIQFFFGNVFLTSFTIRTLGVLREVWDGLVPFNWSPRVIQGWSWKDLIANEAGIHAAQTFILFLQGDTWKIINKTIAAVF